MNRYAKSPALYGVVILLFMISSCDQAPSAIAEGYISVNEKIRLHYRLLGTGSDTLVIPLQTWWYPHVEPLLPGRTLILYDPRDRGRSDAAHDTSLSMENEVRDLEAIRRHFGIGRLTLIGWSYLGAVVARYAMDYPDRVARIVQVGAMSPRYDPFVPQAFADMAARADPAADRRIAEMRDKGLPNSDPVRYCHEYWRAMVHKQLADTTVVDAVLAAGICEYKNEWPQNMGFRHILIGLGSWDWRAEASTIEVPVLVVHGAQDNFPVESSREWAEIIPHARLLAIEGAGHYPHVEQPEIFFDSVNRFLTGEWPPGAEAVR